MLRRLFIFSIILSNLAWAQPDWQKQVSPTNDHLHDVFFLDDSLGWAYSYGTGLILNTTNGGDSWEIQSQLDSLFFEQIQFVDENNGWLSGERGFVYKSSDGGKSWGDVSPPVSERILEGFDWQAKEKPQGWYVLLYAQHFFDADEGFVAGGKFQPSAENAWQKMQPIFLATKDGGRNWEEVEQAPRAFLNQTTFLNDSLGYAVGSGKIFQTPNKGKSWKTVFENGSSDIGQLRGLFFLSQQNGYAVSFSGKFLMTTDAAKNWETIAISENRLRGVVFIDEKNGFAVGDANKVAGTLFQTTDGGASWQQSATEYPDLHRIKLSPTKIWIVGKDGTILKREKYAEKS